MPRTKSLRPSTPPAHLQHAISRLDLVLMRLSQATSSDPLEAVPLSAADAVVLRDLVTDALEDCEELRRAAVSLPEPRLSTGLLERVATVDVNLSGDALMGELDRLAREVDERIGNPDDNRARVLVDGVLLDYVAGIRVDDVLFIASHEDFLTGLEAVAGGDAKVQS